MLGICLGMQLLFDSSTENRAPSGIGVLRGTVGPISANGYKVPHIGWSPVRWEHESELTRGWARRRPSTSSTRSSRARPSRGDVLGTAEYGERFACAVERPPLYGAQFHPEKSSAAGLRLLENFTAHPRSRGPRPPTGLILYPGDRHPRRPRRAPAPGRLRPRDRLRRRPRRRRPALGGRRSQLAARRRPGRRPRRRAGQPGPRAAHRRGASAIPVQLGGGLRDSKKVEEAISAGAERVVLGTAAVRDPEMAEAIASAHGDRVVAAVDARPGRSPPRAGPSRRASGPPSWRRSSPSGGCGGSSTRRSRWTARWRGRTLESLREVAAATDAEMIYSGGVGSLDDLAGAGGPEPAEPRRA